MQQIAVKHTNVEVFGRILHVSVYMYSMVHLIVAVFALIGTVMDLGLGYWIVTAGHP